MDFLKQYYNDLKMQDSNQLQKQVNIDAMRYGAAEIQICTGTVEWNCQYISAKMYGITFGLKYINFDIWKNRGNDVISYCLMEVLRYGFMEILWYCLMEILWYCLVEVFQYCRIEALKYRLNNLLKQTRKLIDN